MPPARLATFVGTALHRAAGSRCAVFWARPSRAEVWSAGSSSFEAVTETYPMVISFSTADAARSLLRDRLRLRRRGSRPVGAALSAPLHLRLTHVAVGTLRTRVAALRRAGSFRSTVAACDRPPARDRGRTRTTEEDR